ncbi:MAG: ATP-binding protein [Neisseriaceae bacterium]|nr:ATP-binding protein [Neisseriaceae bacterium]MBP6860823.1 ATP-binding protein [Neisseriaceae bacterium]
MEQKLAQTATDCLKFVVYGPESTGKTTLARQLAEHYHTQWVPEFSRDYLQEKWDLTQTICEESDLLPIALGQMAAENAAAAQANRVLFLDTNVRTTVLYAHHYYGRCAQWLTDLIASQTYTLYFLTDIDVPWVADDLRDQPQERAQLFAKFKADLQAHGLPYVLLQGDEASRLAAAIAVVDAHLAGVWNA